MGDMKPKVLFIQGGGEGAYDEDALLAASLQNELGDGYEVVYPKMPNEDDPEYESWRDAISEALAKIDGKVIAVGHSAGAAIWLQYLATENVEGRVAGAFIIASPYWDEFNPQLPDLPLFLYHNRDDEIIPFDHLAMFAEKLPQATIRIFDTGGHQFNNDLSQVAADIQSL